MFPMPYILCNSLHASSRFLHMLCEHQCAKEYDTTFLFNLISIDACYLFIFLCYVIYVTTFLFLTYYVLRYVVLRRTVNSHTIQYNLEI